MELIELNAKSRETKGKGAARVLRRNNAIPAIVYGAKTEPAMLSLETVEFIKIIREHGSTGLFFKLKVEGASGKEKIVMLKDMQMDTFGLNYLHIDLHEIDMDTIVTVSVPVETIGESVGVKEGGLLQIIRRELDVVCKPADTPSSIQIDINDLDVGDSVHIEDIDLGENVEIPHDVNFTVITIGAPTIEEEEIDEDEELLEEGEVEAAPADEETAEE
ncbi:MAG: 50S ribosomal protein L25 [Desulfobacula sp.]|uniref:50S ribosomal protein L25 n=1 Tax=Desulfobacula sp. TaxID=2593537 RepID=UPI0025BF9305|nr:50S ribosomal protein L25 [Desulfobacula sp.]MCD4718579.1 50S ribosomal protein L25 [Desulfobacula sp.]